MKQYLYGINAGAVMDIWIFKNKNTYKISLGLAKKKYKLLTIYTGIILNNQVIWNKPKFPK